MTGPDDNAGAVEHRQAAAMTEQRFDDVAAAIVDLAALGEKVARSPFPRRQLALGVALVAAIYPMAIVILLAVGTIEPSDAKVLLIVVMIALYPSVSSVYCFYFPVRFANEHHAPRRAVPEAAPDELTRRAGGDAPLTPAGLDHYDVVKWVLGATAAGIVILAFWSSRDRPAQKTPIVRNPTLR